MGDRRRKGRVEVGLDNQLVEARQVPAAARAGLRALARGLDVAEASADPDLIATIGRAYFDALKANGLTAAEVRPADAFDQLLADISRASPGAGHPAPP
jgi:hypothetical protein